MIAETNIGIALAHTLSHFRGLKSSDFRDKVFAFVGMDPEELSIQRF
jgi:hypothetical protein